MEIRFANYADFRAINRSIMNKNIPYISTSQIKNDIANQNMIVAIINGKIVGGLSIVNEERHGYYALKRGCVYNKKNNGKGIMSALFEYALSLNLGDYGCTPWAENSAILHLMNKYGFEYRFTAHNNYLVHIRQSN